MQSKKIKRSALFAALLIIIMLLSCIQASADNKSEPDLSGGKAVVLYDKTHKKYIIEQEGFALVNTSTSAKITLGLIACETLAERLDETVTITDEMLAGASGYSMKLKSGEKISIRDLLYGAICGSYNDAAYALAHICGGSSAGFVDMMNAKAQALGAKNTKYVNPLGYPDNGEMKTTAYDTLKIALAASDNELYMEICSAMKHTVKATNMSESRYFSNRNYLVSAADYRYGHSSCYGMNAGYSGEAGGWSIVTLIRDKDKNGQSVDYICVLLGGSESEDGSDIYAYKSVCSVADWVCGAYDFYRIFPEGTQLGTTKIGLSLTDNAPYVTAEELYVYLPTADRKDDVSYKIELNDDIRAPLEAGDVIGKVVVSSGGERLGECDLVLKESYEVNGVMKTVDLIGSYVKSRAFIATVICFVVLLAATLVFRRFGRYNSREKFTRKR